MSAKKTKTSGGFTAAERAAMQERASELKAAARRGSRAGKADVEAEVLAKLDAMPEPDRGIGRRFHQHIKFIHIIRAAIHDDLIMRRDVAYLQQHCFDLRRKDVDAADDDHVVGSPDDSLHPDGGALACAFLTDQPRPVSRPIAQQRKRLFGDAGEDKLSHFAVRQPLARVGVNDLRNEMILGDVHPLLLCAFD